MRLLHRSLLVGLGAALAMGSVVGLDTSAYAVIKPMATHTVAARKAETIRAAATTRAPADASTVRRTWGITIPDVPGDSAPLTALTAKTSRRPDVVMWYVAWSLRSQFPVADANRVRSWGATPEITWEPWDPSAGVDQPAYSLAKISNGAYDSYLRSWARAAKAWGHPLRLRFAQEMNGNWYPWAQGVNGNGRGSYVAAWKHIRKVFADEGATRVTWVWSPNVPFPGSTPLAKVFPGDKSVSEVALDGYNWGTSQPNSQWMSFSDVFGPGMKQLAALSKRPVSIGEVGSAETGGSKAAWMAGMWHTLASWSQVRGVMWFDFDKEADWRIDSSQASLDAFSKGLASYLAR